ncbi:putative Ulp1 protease family catalytic domain, papain-like cysteine peptidase superfamily [Helianthus annuus]|nr:putative Ulp1 protease family catalytic domain, papain-like cysteine peptidase superfamily [Helianthus annuus]
MSKRGKRGVASFQKNYKEEDYKVEFDQNNRPVGAMSSPFMSWFGLKVRQTFPYHIDTKKFDTNRWEELWLDAKDISEKAKASANANTNFSRLGRTGYAGLDAKADTIWPILEAKYSYLKNIQDKRTKAWIMSQKIKNPETNSYELAPESHEKVERLVRTEREMIADGSYFAGKDDPIIRVMGREHGGRTRAVSEVIGSTNVYGGLFNNGKKRARNGDSLDVNEERGSVSLVDNISSPGFCGASAFGGPTMSYPPIKKLTPCELLFPFQLSDELTVAIGQIWPTSDRFLHGKLIDDGFVKVQVDNVIEGCEKMPILEVTKTDDIKRVRDMLHSFVQWPWDALKIVDKDKSNRLVSAPTMDLSLGSSSHTGVLPQIQTGDVAATSCYHPGPEIEEDDPNELQMPSQQNIDQMSFMNMTRPRAIQDMVELLSRCVGDNHSILISSPARMYPQTVQDSIPYVELLQLFSNDWLDISVIHWFAIDHWTLIVICPSTERGYIIDSINREKDQHSYLLTSVIDEAFGFPFLWDMVNCKQQKNGWECGFMVIKNMYEFVNTIQHDFPIKASVFYIFYILCVFALDYIFFKLHVLYLFVLALERERLPSAKRNRQTDPRLNATVYQ